MVKLLDFYSEWCPPCQTQKPVIEALEKRFRGRVVFEKVNVDGSKRASDYDIVSIPTLVIEKNGKEVKRFVRLTSEAVLIKALEEALKT